MLTDEQRNQLTELRDSIEDKKLKRIVNDAIEGWEYTKPTPYVYGIRYSKDVIVPSLGNSCLLGAAALGKPSYDQDDQPLDFDTWFDLSVLEEMTIMDMFDGRDNNKDHPWYPAISKIREIVLCEKLPNTL